MRRSALIAITCAVAVAAVVLLPGSRPQGYRVDAIFDTAKDIVPGQLVKIAGARVGTVSAVTLEPGPSARIAMSIDHRFAPFHGNATCQILPEGLISENYIQCNPGTAGSTALTGSPSEPPTVPLTHTTVPVSLQDVLNIFSVPTDERISVLINELGIAPAGRGGDINAVLERTDPALIQYQRTLSILDAQHQQIAAAVGQTNTILAALNQRSSAVRGFVDNAADVLRTTASRRVALGQAVNRLPALLTALTAALSPVQRLTDAGGPLLDELRQSTPALTTLTRVLPAFTRPAIPAVKALGSAAQTGRAALPALAPVVAHAATFATTANPTVTELDRFLVSTRDAGGFEGLLRFIYSIATETGGYDGVSHMLAIGAAVYGRCLVNQQAAGCDHRLSAPGLGTIPINDPAAGPQLNEWASRNGASTSSAASLAPTGKPPTAEQAKALLDFLLK